MSRSRIIMPALVFLALVITSAGSTRRVMTAQPPPSTEEAAESPPETDWRSIAILWLTPAAMATAITIGGLLRLFLKKQTGIDTARSVDRLEEVPSDEKYEAQAVARINETLKRGGSTYRASTDPLPPDFSPIPHQEQTVDTVSAAVLSSTPYREESRMNVSQFQPKDAVSVAGRLYQGTGNVTKVEAGKVFVKCGDSQLRSYTQDDLNLGRLYKQAVQPTMVSAPAGQPKAATVADFGLGCRVHVAGDLYRGNGTVQPAKVPGKLRVRGDNGKTYVFGQGDLNSGKVTKFVAPSVAQVAPSAQAPPAAKSVLTGQIASQSEAKGPLGKSDAPQSGKVTLPPGGDVVISVGDISITIRHNAKA